MKIRFWRIVPQIIKVEGVETETPVKQIRYFPYKDKKTGEQKWGRLQSAPWQVVIQRANWPEDKVWRIQYNPTTGLFKIDFGDSISPVDPTDRKWSPDKTQRIVKNVEQGSTDMIEKILLNRIKDSSGLPDEEFVDNIFSLLIFAAEGSELPTALVA